MAKKLGDIVGEFIETYHKEYNMMGRFLRIKVKVDLQNPLKRGIVMKYQEKRLEIFYNYERLLTFCFVCGKIGYKLEYYMEIGEGGSEGYEEIVDQNLSFGPWLHASPLPRNVDEVRKNQSSGSLSRNLFEIPDSKKMQSYKQGRRRW